MGQVELYAKKDSLQQTLPETRARLQRWQAVQRDARQAIRVGEWQQATLAAAQTFDGSAATRPDAAADPQGQRGGLRWDRCRADASRNPNLGGSTADYLRTAITAGRPVTLTIELSRHERFGGFAYRPPPSGAGVQPSDALVWLNGRQLRLHEKLPGYSRVPVAKRFGWHEALLIDVPLAAGENRLALSLRKGPQKSWFTVVR